jgi:hypothetical protein
MGLAKLVSSVGMTDDTSFARIFIKIQLILKMSAHIVETCGFIDCILFIVKASMLDDWQLDHLIQF